MSGSPKSDHEPTVHVEAVAQAHAAARLWATLDGLERQAKDTGLADLAFFIGLARVAAEEFLRDAVQDDAQPIMRN